MSSIKQQDITRAFGKALRALRERTGFTQDGLSNRGISRTHIIAMEKGTSDPKLTSLVKLASALGVPFMTLAREIDRAMT
ncbi:MAG TPA: helix-turn-helix transcriptional regulator, partial [Bryobacteraceae bacterium]|nr:helix-turn-helix transcriptional regulator [Bryobacteraceae bacterium]